MISTHAPAGGATSDTVNLQESLIFLLTPLREGRPGRPTRRAPGCGYFYSRPCGRGDPSAPCKSRQPQHFYSRPCGRGDESAAPAQRLDKNFYSRPCGRGDQFVRCYGPAHSAGNFYSRPCGRGDLYRWYEKNGCGEISTHAPAGGATRNVSTIDLINSGFLLTPLREGRRGPSRRGAATGNISTHAPAGGATSTASAAT